MGHSAKAVANALLHIASEHQAQVTPLKLQKLAYIAHGWSLGLLNEPLVTDELPEAWQYGPVFPSLYHEFKEYGKGSIGKKATDLNFTGTGLQFQVEEPTIPEDDKLTWALLRKVWDQYGKYGGIALSDLTHRAGTPWEQTWNASKGVRNADISNEIIKAHYDELRAKNVQKKTEAEVG